MPRNAQRAPRRARTVGALAVAGLLALATPMIAYAASPSPDQPGEARRHANRDISRDVERAIDRNHARNVILLIGDGMGDSEITIARNYLYGAAGRLPGIDALPLTGSYTTYSLYRDGSALAGLPDYVPDSAATGTAWATGTKTYDNAVGVDIHGVPHANLLELAKANGLKTGNVTTSEIQDATPAVLLAHVAQRGCYGPDSLAQCGADLLENGGRGSISEQLLNTRPDVTLGGGAATFGQSAHAGDWAGQTLFAQAENRGYQLVDTAAELAAVSKANQDRPLLGLFAPGNLPTRFAATPATVGGSGSQVAQTCQANPSYLGEGLTLADLTEKAIGLLNDKKSRGFFLQVEGASIDKQDHAANACGQIGETQDFDEAVQVALEFAKRDKNTLVIVTADHAHTSLIVDGATPGLGITLLTADGAPLRISYGTAGEGGSQQHTGSQIRIAAFGPRAANVVGLSDQTDTFYTIVDALRLDRNADIEG
jgi:alkaline phosphatase